PQKKFEAKIFFVSVGQVSGAENSSEVRCEWVGEPAERIMAEKAYWWDSYGPFDPDEDGYPNAGQVVRHYRLLKKWTPPNSARPWAKQHDGFKQWNMTTPCPRPSHAVEHWLRY